MSSIKTNLTELLKKSKLSRRHLRRYSWLPDVLRVEGSVAIRIAGPVLTVTLFAWGVAYAWSRGYNVTLSNSVTPLLAVVVGLILVFRNGTSYDRFYEGRRDFGQLVSNIRNLSRLIWVCVAVPPDLSAATPGKGLAGGSGQKPMSAAHLRKLKVDALRLCVAFVYAVKHHLRGESGIDYEDYEGILPPSITRHEDNGSNSSNSGDGKQNKPWRLRHRSNYVVWGTLRPIAPPTRKVETVTTVIGSGSRITRSSSNSSIRSFHGNNGPKQANTPGPHHHDSHGLHFTSDTVTISDQRATTPLLSDNHRTVEFHSSVTLTDVSLPLVIAHELSRVIFKFRRDGYLETIGPAGTNAMNALVQGMTDQLTNMERIVTTPIPISYAIHLKQCVTLYVFALPFTLVKELGWWMIPVVTVVAFTLMGIEGIADEIEMPFGNDPTDLPLDNFCAELKDEIDFIITRMPEGGEGMYGYDDGAGDD